MLFDTNRDDLWKLSVRDWTRGARSSQMWLSFHGSPWQMELWAACKEHIVTEHGDMDVLDTDKNMLEKIAIDACTCSVLQLGETNAEQW